MPKTKWMGDVLSRHPGALHRQLGISTETKVPKTLLTRIVKADTGNIIKNPTSTGKRRYRVTRLMKQRATPALTARGFKRRRRGKLVH